MKPNGQKKAYGQQKKFQNYLYYRYKRIQSYIYKKQRAIVLFFILGVIVFIYFKLQNSNTYINHSKIKTAQTEETKRVNITKQLVEAVQFSKPELIDPDKQYQYFLSVAAVSRNEQHILREFILHYLAEGVEHLYIGDNDSDDQRAYIYAMYEWMRSGIVDLIHTIGAFDQYEFYNYFILPLAYKETKWLLVVDSDEFVYAPQKGALLSTALQTIEKYNGDLVTQMCAPWVVYSASSDYAQPRCVSQTYTQGQWEDNNFGKCFVRPQYTYQLAIHTHIITRGITICSNGYIYMDYAMEQICNRGGCSIPRANVCQVRSKNNDTNEYLAITNHYQIQSQEYFQKVRMVRKERMPPEWKAYWNLARWKELNKSLGTHHIPQLAEKKNVDFCFKDSDTHIGLDRLRKEVRSYNMRYAQEIEGIAYQSNYVNPNIQRHFYQLPDLTNHAYTTAVRNVRLLNYNGTKIV